MAEYNVFKDTYRIVEKSLVKKIILITDKINYASTESVKGTIEHAKIYDTKFLDS